MSLETQIEKLNANFEVLIGLLQSGAPIPAPSAPEPKPAKTAAPKPAAKPAPAPKAEAPAPDAEVSVADVQKITVELLAKRGRDVVITLLKSFDAAKATDVQPDDRARYYADAKTLLAA